MENNLPNGVSCRVVKDGTVLFESREKGILPLIRLCESGMDVVGAFAADRIVGKAAALLYAHLGVAEVYADVLCRPGLAVLKEYGVRVRYGTLTQNIRNRKGDGICPMEQAVQMVDDPAAALTVLTEKVHAMAKREHIDEYSV